MSSLFAADFNAGLLTNTASTAIKFTHGSASSITSGRYFLDGISGGNYIEVTRDPSLFGQRTFTFSMDFQTATAGKGGHVFAMMDSLHIDVTDGGQVVFNLIGNQAGQRGSITSTNLRVTDGANHSLKVVYDADAGKMVGYVDGQAVGQIAVSAAMKTASYWDPQVGHAWSGAFRGYVDNIKFANDGVTVVATPTPTSTATPTPTATDTTAKTLFAADFGTAGQLVNIAATGVKITHGTASSVSGGSYFLDGASGGNYIGLSRDPSLFAQKQLDISFDFKAASVGKGGHIFRMMDSLAMDVTDEGQARFTLSGNQANQSGVINTTGLKIADGGWHNLRLNYDAVAGKMTGYVDGQAVGSIAVTAATKAASYWDPMVGDAWSGAFRGNVDNIKFASDWGAGTPTPAPTPVPAPTPTVTNTPPVGGADSATVAQDGSLSLKLATLMANDSDPNGDAISITAAKLTGGQGTVQFNAGSDILYTPTKGWAGTASVEYTLTDAKGAAVQVPVTVTVTPAPAPVPTGPLTTDQLFANATKIFATPILANNSAELVSALQRAAGGETILLRSDVDYKLVASNLPAHAQDVVVTSLDPTKMANITGLELRYANNIVFDNLHFEFKGTPVAYQTDVMVTNSANITFSDSVFKGTASGFAYTKTAQDMLYISDSSNISFNNNEVTNFFHGVQAFRSFGIEVSNNDLHDIQGDGMRFAQVQGINIQDNWLHDFLGADGNLNHNDYIQFWTAGTTTGNRDVTIKGNLIAHQMNPLHESQAIFMRDENGDSGSTATRYKNVTIADNYIYDNHYHGITIGRVDGVSISDNTLPTMPNGMYNMVSSVNVANSTGVQVFENYSPRYDLGTNNQFVRNDANTTPAKLQAIIAGVQNGNTYTVDGHFSTNANGYIGASDAQFQWDFGDGAKATGMKATHTYANAGDHQIVLTVLHNDGSSDTARLFDSATTGVDQTPDANGSVAFLHTVDPWGL